MMRSVNPAQTAGFEESPASTKHFVVGEVLKGSMPRLGFQGSEQHIMFLSMSKRP
jgi:hypothetical protein